MLSKKAQYSIYALVKLAREEQGQRLLIGEIAESESIPKKFLENILLELKNNGFVGSKKGKGGGYFLIKKPDEINLADIIRLFDGAIALLPCAAFKYYQPCSFCKDEEKCGVRSVIKDIREETVKMMKNTTLQNIIDREK
jgi:Rrf2 family protein